MYHRTKARIVSFYDSVIAFQLLIDEISRQAVDELARLRGFDGLVIFSLNDQGGNVDSRGSYLGSLPKIDYLIDKTGRHG